MSLKQILVVEDEEHISSLLREIIRLHDGEALIAEAAEAAFFILEEKPVDMAIIDLTLPDGNGLTLARKLQQLYPYLKGKVLFTSGYEPEEDLLQHMEESSDRFIAKPFHLEDIRELLTVMMVS